MDTSRPTYTVAVIGGGITGLLTAYHLSQDNISCAIFESKKVGSGATSKTTAFLTQFVDTRLKDLGRIFGKEGAKHVWESHRQAIDEVESIIKKELIDCSFMRCSNYYYAASEKDFKDVEQEGKIAKGFGFPVVLQEQNDLPFKNHGYLEIKNQAKFSIFRFMDGLKISLEKRDIPILEGTEITHIEKEEKFFKLTSATGDFFYAKNVAICTYQPLGRQKQTGFKKGMYVSYVMELQIPKNFLPHAIYEDTENPYNYFRIDSKDEWSDTMVIGGQDHRQEIPVDEAKSFSAIESYVKNLFPGLEYKILSRWSGPILEPADGIALIGEVSENKYVATAFSGNGMTYSAISARLLSDLIMGRKNPYADLYNPKRIPTLAALILKGRDYVEILLGGAIKNTLKKPEK